MHQLKENRETQTESTLAKKASSGFNVPLPDIESDRDNNQIVSHVIVSAQCKKEHHLPPKEKLEVFCLPLLTIISRYFHSNNNNQRRAR